MKLELSVQPSSTKRSTFLIWIINRCMLNQTVLELLQAVTENTM